MKNILKNIFQWFFRPFQRRTIGPLIASMEENRMLTAKLLIQNIRRGAGIENLCASEFSVFSQTGEDGIIQFLLSKIPIQNDIFIEFGVEDYSESNTRFLLMNDNWRGVVIDGSPANIESIRRSPLYWRRDLTAICDFVTRDNINRLIESCGISGDIGLLSIDIDGNDYWVWEKIDIISPRIVVCEYNALFGPKEAVTIPYSDNFVRTQAHYSRLYFGASLKALCALAERKGYIYIGSNSVGVNAFFVRKDVAGDLRALSPEEGFATNRVRESIDRKGRNTFLSGDDRIKLIREMRVVDILTGEEKPIKELDLF